METVTGTASGARATVPSPSMLPAPVPPSEVSATSASPLTVPVCAVEKLSRNVVAFDPPAAMSPVGPAPATANPPVAPVREAISASENPSAGATLLTSSVSTPGSPACANKASGAIEATASR